MSWRVADDTIVYAIGDIHGRVDLLACMTDMILEDASHRSARHKVIVYLGDYIDRGDNSYDVIEFLINQRDCKDGFRRVFLLGNHEDEMLGFLRGDSFGFSWIEYCGGKETIRSYGVEPHLLEHDIHGSTSMIRRALQECVPASHEAFLKSLVLTHEEGDYLFVHAGIRPDIPIAEQDPDDLIWIREDFLYSHRNFGKVVVHGHSISWDGPAIRPNRIGIDTGAFATGVLTCLVLHDDQRSFIQTT